MNIERRFMIAVLQLLMYLIWKYPSDKPDIKDVEALIEELKG